MKPVLLGIGDRGIPDIKVIQEKLLLKPDGIFGPKTLQGVRNMASEYNSRAQFKWERVRTDGVVDDFVWRAAGLSAYARRVPVPAVTNTSRVVPARQSTMIALFGEPRSELTLRCANITNTELANRIVYGKQIGPLRVSGMREAVDSLTAVMASVVEEEPDLYVRLSSAGMLCCRAVRGSVKNWSNHSWGTAIDMLIDDMLDPCGDGYCQFGLLVLSRIFNRHGWYWGAGFGREDSMHFEAGEELVRRFAI